MSIYRGPRTLVGNRRKYAVSHGGGRQAIGQAGMRFIEAQMNPFGSDTIGPKSFRSLIPDGNGSVSTPVVLTASETISAAGANAQGLVGFAPLTYDTSTAHGALWYSGGTAGTATAAHSATPVRWNEDTMFASAVTAHKKFRIVGCGLRCYAISSPDNTQGMLTAALSPHLVAPYATDQGGTNAAGTQTVTMTTVFTPYVVEESHPLIGSKSGISIRRPYQNTDHEYSDLSALSVFDNGTTAGTNSTKGTTLMNTGHVNWGNMPMIKYEGLGANTILRFDAVLHLEILVNATSWPGYLTNSPCEIGFSSIVAFTNSHEVVVSGHAFKSFVRAR